MKTLGLIHTSFVFVTRETLMSELFREIMPDVRLINIVDDSLLCNLMEHRRLTAAEIRRMCAYVQAAGDAGADAVLSLCSSLGPAIDVARPQADIPVIKIDDAMTRKAVEQAQRIAVMATNFTTMEPTTDLIRRKAAAAGRPVEISEKLVSGAFDALMAGDAARHDEMVVEAAETLPAEVELILFAQASMTRLAPRVEQAAGKPVLTSPRLAIEHARRVLDGHQP